MVTQCIKGNTTAYRQLYDRYSKAMFNTALRITANRADAEDVLQESFTDAFTQLREIGNRSSFGGWLKQIVVFKSIALLKKRKLWLVELGDEADVHPDEPEPDDNEIAFAVESIRETMKELPDGYRAVLTLYLLEGYDHEEIAGILQVTQSTIRTQYKRGKEKLLQLLKKEKVHG